MEIKNRIRRATLRVQPQTGEESEEYLEDRRCSVGGSDQLRLLMHRVTGHELLSQRGDFVHRPQQIMSDDNRRHS